MFEQLQIHFWRFSHSEFGNQTSNIKKKIVLGKISEFYLQNIYLRHDHHKCCKSVWTRSEDDLEGKRLREVENPIVMMNQETHNSGLKYYGNCLYEHIIACEQITDIKWQWNVNGQELNRCKSHHGSTGHQFWWRRSHHAATGALAVVMHCVTHQDIGIRFEIERRPRVDSAVHAVAVD